MIDDPCVLNPSPDHHSSNRWLKKFFRELFPYLMEWEPAINDPHKYFEPWEESGGICLFAVVHLVIILYNLSSRFWSYHWLHRIIFDSKLPINSIQSDHFISFKKFKKFSGMSFLYTCHMVEWEIIKMIFEMRTNKILTLMGFCSDICFFALHPGGSGHNLFNLSNESFSYHWLYRITNDNFISWWTLL